MVRTQTYGVAGLSKAALASVAAAMLPLLVLPDGGDFLWGLAVTVAGGLLAALASLAMFFLLEPHYDVSDSPASPPSNG